MSRTPRQFSQSAFTTLAAASAVSASWAFATPFKPPCRRVARRPSRPGHVIDVDRDLLFRAGTLAPSDMRSLDAIHVAAALSIGDDLGELLTYDIRMAAAARAHGITVASPT